MENITYIDWDDDLAAVKYQNQWRFFYAQEGMFFLDYTKWDSQYEPQPGEYRWGTLVVDAHNATAWMNQMTEVSPAQIPQLAYKEGNPPMPLRFVIDFDQQLWVGCGWQFDQFALTDYQPDGWTAKEDDVLDYLPAELGGYWKADDACK